MDLRVGGYFTCRCFDRNGKLKWTRRAKNGITNAGLNYLLNSGFDADTQITAWYIGLVNNAGWTAFAAADTMASHDGWVETHTTYDEATRVQWNPAESTAQSSTNTSPAEFTMNDTITIKGFFLASSSTKGESASTLWATAAFDVNADVVDDDVLQATYTLNAAGA